MEIVKIINSLIDSDFYQKKKKNSFEIITITKSGTKHTVMEEQEETNNLIKWLFHSFH